MNKSGNPDMQAMRQVQIDRVNRRGWRIGSPGRARRRLTKMYRMWTNIKSRCNNPKIECYRHYGGKGIQVCEEWSASYASFREWCCAKFREYDGPRKKGSIERIDPDRDYCPANCAIIHISDNIGNRNRRR